MQDTGKNNGKNPNEGEIAELVRQKEALTDQENSLQAAKDAISREKKMAYETRERLAARLAEVEKERISEITRLDSIARETARRDGERMVAESKERLAARLAEVDKERAMELARLESLTQDTLRRETERLAAESRARLAERLAEVDKGCAARLAEVDRERAEKNARLDDLAQDLARRERETLESNERLSARLAEVERESSEKLARLESRSHDLARREGEVLDAEKRLQERMKEPVGQILAVEQELKAEKERSALLREEVNNSKAHIESVLREAAVLEEELVGVKEKHFKAEAQKDAEWSKKMNDLIALMGEKERELESSWSRRHNTLETEEKQYHADFEKRHGELLEELRSNAAELEKTYAQKEAKLIELNKQMIAEFQDREAKARAQEEELRGQVSMIAASAAELNADYERKRAELAGYKQKAADEIEKLARGGAAA